MSGVVPAETFTPLTPAPVSGATGGRRGSRKLKVVTRKQARKLLKKLGKKMRGGEDSAPGAVVVEKEETPAPSMGGRKKTRRGKRRSIFGMKY